MTSSEKIDETIAKMRRRLLEIDALIAQIERGGVSVRAKNVTNQLHPVSLCRRTRQTR